MLSTNIKELLTRYAKGLLEFIPDECFDTEVNAVVEAIHDLRKNLNRVDVVSALIRQYPNSVFLSEDPLIDNDALIQVVKNETMKQALIKFDAELSEALMRKKDDPSFDWADLTDRLLQQFSKSKSKEKYVTLDKLTFEESKVVASLGFPELDNCFGGGIGVGSYTIFYAPVNVGKTTIVTRNLACSLLSQGKRPLIISLEGDPNKLGLRILTQLLGFATKDMKELTDYEKSLVLEKSASMPSLPIVNCKASKKWEILKLIRTYEPDVIIYDQLTIGAGGREWTEMAKLSNTLKTIASETGIPIVALTQSSEKNYHGADKTSKEKEEDEGQIGAIKYGQSVLEDADGVVHIAKVFNPMQRMMTVVKTRDDAVAPKLPLKLLVEYTDKGVVFISSNSGGKQPQNAMNVPAKTFKKPDIKNDIDVPY